MKKIKIIHCADLHIGATVSYLGSKAEDRQSEVLMSLERIAALAESESIPLVLIAGDLFDSLGVAERFISGAFSAIEKAENVRFVLSAGNHDPLCPSSPFSDRNGYRSPKNLYVLGAEDDMIEFSELGVRVYGRSLRPGTDMGRARFSLAAEDSFINIMCQHGDMTSGSDYNRITEDFIKESGMDYVALGHIHKRGELKRLGAVSYAYCGSPEGQGFDEEGECGVYKVTVGKDGCSAEFVRICRRMHLWEDADISDFDDPADAAKAICGAMREKYGERCAENLYRITLIGTRPEHGGFTSELKVRLSDALYYVRIRDRTAPKINTDILMRENSLRGIFVRRMRERIDCLEGEEKAVAEQALIKGLEAFDGEVSLDEDN